MKISPITWSNDIYSFFIVVSEILSHPEWMNRPADFLYAKNIDIEKNSIGERERISESHIIFLFFFFLFRAMNRVIDQCPSTVLYWPPKYTDESSSRAIRFHWKKITYTLLSKTRHLNEDNPFLDHTIRNQFPLNLVLYSIILYSRILKNFDGFALIV